MPYSVDDVRNPRAGTGPGAAVIVLNWNGWKNTIECLESVFRLNYPAFTVVICDNGSTDGSMDRIRAWAEGKLAATCSSADLTRLVVPPVAKPISHVTIDAADPAAEATPGVRLVLIPTGANRGFAGGNNVGLRYALSRPDIEYFWVLNNDTVVEEDALSRLIGTMLDDPQLGLCGSVLRSYGSPGSVLTLGGRKYNRWTGRTTPILPDSNTDERQHRVVLDYVEAASVLVSRSFLDTVGLMAEDYFLYFEEMDWAMRAGGRFGLDYSPQSIVYHKEGGSIGSHKDRNQRSALSDFFQARNRLIFTRRYFPSRLPLMALSVVVTAVHRFLTGRRENGAAVVKGIFAGLNRRCGAVG
jgi:hypothetical protein